MVSGYEEKNWGGLEVNCSRYSSPSSALISKLGFGSSSRSCWWFPVSCQRELVQEFRIGCKSCAWTLLHTSLFQLIPSSSSCLDWGAAGRRGCYIAQGEHSPMVPSSKHRLKSELLYRQTLSKVQVQLEAQLSFIKDFLGLLGCGS